MNSNKNQPPQASNEAAQTASIGDDQMMTYMKMPLNLSETASVGVANNATSSPNGGSGGEESDLHFLDGLFDPMSGSSDNGSDKGDNADNNGGGGAGGQNTAGADGTKLLLGSTSALNSSQTQAQVQANINQSSTANATMSRAALSVNAAGNVTNSNNPSSSLPLNPLQNQVSHMTSTDTTSMPTMNVPQHQHVLHHRPSSQLNHPQQQQINHQQQQQHSATVQHHSQHVGNMTSRVGGNARPGEGMRNPQTNEAIRTMSDVSSLSSSNGGNNTPPDIHQFSTQSYSNQQQQQIQQVQQIQQIQQQQVMTNNPAQSGQFQSWIMPTNTSFQTNNAVAQTMSLQQHQPPQTLSNSAVQPFKPKTILNPTGTNTAATTTTTNIGKGGKQRKRKHDTPQTTEINPPHNSISEDEGDAQKRRRDRNQREQERSQRIANQILHLKELLAASNIPFKPDKYSTLVSVHGYIKSLQQRNVLIDAEHKKLVDTITGTNELVTKAQVGPNSVPQNNNTSSHQVITSSGAVQVISGAAQMTEEEEELLQYVRGVDYKSVFTRVNIGFCVTRIDGRIIDCNHEFTRITGLTQEELLKAGIRMPTQSELSSPGLSEQCGKHPISLFNLIAKEDMEMIFRAMSNMLTSSTSPVVKAEESKSDGNGIKANTFSSKLDHWVGIIRRCHTSKQQVRINAHNIPGNLSPSILLQFNFQISILTHFPLSCLLSNNSI